MSDAVETLGVADLSRILRRTPRTITNDLHRRPESLPPRLRIPGSRRLLWLRRDVDAWLEAARERRPGRPRHAKPI